ncbi:MAG: ATP synthase F0 subunit B [Deltaproteobacteria bacterium]|nr:ATP synthase F0 subunit B [Deltaproteobacteria bacterium]
MRAWWRWGVIFLFFLVFSGLPLVAIASEDVDLAPGLETEEAVEREIHETVEVDTTAKQKDLLYRAINFGILAAVMVILLRKPMGRMLANRNQGIKEDLENLEKRKEEAARSLEENLARLKSIEAEKDKIIQEFVAAGNAEKEKILAQAEEMAARIKEQTRASIELETEKARTQLQAEIAEKSATKAFELIQAKITPEDRDRLVNDYLDKVVG